MTAGVSGGGEQAAPTNLHVDLLLGDDSSCLQVALCLLQLIRDQLLDGVLLVFVHKLLDGLPHALLRQQRQLHRLRAHAHTHTRSGTHHDPRAPPRASVRPRVATCSAASKYCLTRSSTLSPSTAVGFSSLLRSTLTSSDTRTRGAKVKGQRRMSLHGVGASTGRCPTFDVLLLLAASQEVDDVFGVGHAVHELLAEAGRVERLEPSAVVHLGGGVPWCFQRSRGGTQQIFLP